MESLSSIKNVHIYLVDETETETLSAHFSAANSATKHCDTKQTLPSSSKHPVVKGLSQQLQAARPIPAESKVSAPTSGLHVIGLSTLG